MEGVQKNPLGLKIILSTIFLAVLLFATLIAWFGYLDLRDSFRSPMETAANSSLVILARLDTSAPANLFVTEVWKQPVETSAQSIKVGTKIPFGWANYTGPLPSGAVIFYHRDKPIPFIRLKPKLTLSKAYFIHQEHVDDMTVQQFKTKCGL